DFFDQNWPWRLWLVFVDAPVLCFEPLGSGEGFRLKVERSLPAVTAGPQPQLTYLGGLSQLPPSRPSPRAPCGRSPCARTRPGRRARPTGTCAHPPARRSAFG